MATHYIVRTYVSEDEEYSIDSEFKDSQEVESYSARDAADQVNLRETIYWGKTPRGGILYKDIKSSIFYEVRKMSFGQVDSSSYRWFED